ncbi:DUF2793 domain-containing protein [Loktanella sp. SALINAS62]|uniref:DUF2793 domain-containing protein n=1 Tax=Loktanella sp. SALINAS62 TaxID=2706124 RepID=UPI001B8D6648|nr:DUF2793 domain-containing protein [Loktanella sp. SALINAS62]MBS1301759.1 DUF2793 domain-containing protein [Loktanella sp. SALINAS62]
MTTFSPRLDLPFLEAAQAQKHVTHNEALERLDLIVQGTLEAFDAVLPPAAPAEGACWHLGTAPTGVWAGHDGQIAAFAGGGWLFVTPAIGWRLWDRAGGMLRVNTGAGWDRIGGPPDLDNLAGVGVNAASDETNRLVVASDATLLTHAGAGHQLKVNKATAIDTASLLFQSGWSGRAEMGLAGNDDFAIKVSADGPSFVEALRIDAATGAVTLPATPVVATGPQPPALCQLRNTDTTTDLLSLDFADVPMNGVADMHDTAVFARLGDGIQCLQAGRVRIHGQVTGDGGTLQRVAFNLSVAVNGTRFPGIGQSSYARSWSGHRTGTSAISRWLDVAAGDVITLQSQKASDILGPMVMTAGESILIVEHYR